MAQEYTDDDQNDYYEKLKKKQKKDAKIKKAKTTTDCRSPEGVTVTLIDGIIGMSRVIRLRLDIDGLTPAIIEALKDLVSDEDLKKILDYGRLN